MQEADRVKLEKVLRGVKVEAIHRPGVRRQYQISTITSQPTHTWIFEGPDDIQIFVGKYFQEKYKCHLQYDGWPCLHCGSEFKPTYLPMEVCKWFPVRGIQRSSMTFRSEGCYL
jgi:eukaryotic translation initiation factor 2C